MSSLGEDETLSRTPRAGIAALLEMVLMLAPGQGYDSTPISSSGPRPEGACELNAAVPSWRNAFEQVKGIFAAHRRRINEVL